MEERRNDQPASWASKTEKSSTPQFEKLFQGLQVTKEAAATADRHRYMNGNGENPFDSPSSPPTAIGTASVSSSTKEKTRTLCSSFVEVVLRLTVILLLLLAFILIASDRKTTSLPSVLGQVNLKFTYFQAFKYLLSASMIACGFSVIQLVPELYRISTGEMLIPDQIVLYFNFVCDQVLAYMLLSSTSAGMTASELVRNGYDVVWLSLCSGTGFWSFCAQAAASVSMAFFAFLIMASLALLSGYRLAKYLVFA